MLRRIAIRLAGLALAVLATACQTPVRLMPTPVGFTAPDVDPFAGSAAKGASTDVPVLYATNRLPLIETPSPLFTAVPGMQLRVGIAHVRIGDDSSDWETLHRLSTSADIDERPIVQLDWLEPRGVLSTPGAGGPRDDAKAFFALVNRALEASPRREIIVYVHGANSPMPRAAAQAAQFQHFATRRVVVVSFMWPSAGSILRYLTDVANAAASVEPLAQLLRELADNTSASAINVLAYSAGAKITSPALALLAEPRDGLQPAQLRKQLRLRNVYYAAPDADTRIFVDQMSRYIGIVDRVTVAINTKDSALRFSEWLHRVSRAGRPNPRELDDEQLSFIVQASRNLGFDLIHVDPDVIPGLPRRSHAFWYEHSWVSSDVLALLLFDASPPQRGLVERTEANGARLWTFPPDYEQRIVRFFLQSGAGSLPDRARGPLGTSAAPDRQEFKN